MSTPIFSLNRRVKAAFSRTYSSSINVLNSSAVNALKRRFIQGDSLARSSNAHSNDPINNHQSHSINAKKSATLVSIDTDITEADFRRAPINWIPAVVLVATPIAAVLITPWYVSTHDISPKVWASFGLVGLWTGMSITAGYHRLLSHRTYKAHPAVKNVMLLGATLAVQGSAFDWCAGHRVHHRYVDEPLADPYSAKRGFWFSHIGWMLRNYPSGSFDYKNIKDLKKDKVMRLQHKYYGLWVLVTNVGLIGALGWILGDVWGTLLLAGLVRLVLNHHLTFFINSLCHIYGTRPYTDTNTARDNFFLAIPTWGEGYHNYHHFFQYDYRNGVKWWQYDPTKWLIAMLAKVGLASDLRVVDNVTIKHAELQQQLKQLKHRQDKRLIDTNNDSNNVALSPKYGTIQRLFDRLTFESTLVNETIEMWETMKRKGLSLKQTRSTKNTDGLDAELLSQYAIVEKRMSSHQYHLAKNLKQLDRYLGHLKIA